MTTTEQYFTIEPIRWRVFRNIVDEAAADTGAPAVRREPVAEFPSEAGAREYVEGLSSTTGSGGQIAT